MEFNSAKPIFLQIYDILLDKVLSNQFHEAGRIPSVRDLAESIAVNPNTVQRAYAELQNCGIIEQQRGIGYFIAKGGIDLARQLRRDEFIRIQLPLIIHQMKILNISWRELQEIQKQFIEIKE